MEQKFNLANVLNVYIYFNLIHYHCKTTRVSGTFSLNLLLFRFSFNKECPYKLKIRPDHNKEIY